MSLKRCIEYFKGAAICIACGSAVGALIFFFKLFAHELEHISKEIYHAANEKSVIIPFVFLGLILAAVAMCLIHKKVPEVKGGGIPRSEGVVRGILTFRWFPTFICTAVGSMLSFFCGVPVGSEGPSVLIGTSLGKMFGNFSHKLSSWSRYVMTGGAGAGFAAATGAPFSAILFVLEEMQKRFTPLLIMIASTSVISASLVNYYLCGVFGLNPVLFDMGISYEHIQLEHTGYFLLLGVIISLGVVLFDIAVDKYGNLISKLGRQKPTYLMLILSFVLTGVIGLINSDYIYSGHDIVVNIAAGGWGWSALAVVLLIRVGMMLLTTSGKVTGGIFVPSLAIGGLIGALAGKLLMMTGMPEELYGIVVLMSMCAFMGGTSRAPLTATVFFLESTAQFANIFYIAIVVFIVNFSTELVNNTPFYDKVLEDMEHEQNKKKKSEIVQFKVKASSDSFVIGKAARDILWPHSAVVVGIIDAENNRKVMDRDGERKIREGDTIIVQVQVIDMEETVDYIYGLIGRDHKIEIIVN